MVAYTRQKCKEYDWPQYITGDETDKLLEPTMSSQQATAVEWFVCPD